MTDVSITQKKRGPGRPRNNEKIPAASVETVPAVDESLDEAKMQEQIKENVKNLLKLAAKMGVSLDDLFETPPVDTTKIEEAPVVNAEIDAELGITPEPVQAGNDRKPGSYIKDATGIIQGWVPWTRNDLVGTKRVKFIPRPIPTMVYPLQDMYGLQKIKLDVNDLVCWLTCGVENEVYEFFYHAYLNGEQAYAELEHFKAHGPDAAPWGMVGPDGRPSWRFTPSALTFGMDADGKYLIDSPMYERSSDDSGE